MKMDKIKDHQLLHALQKKWIVCTIIGDLFISGGIAFFLMLLTGKLFLWSYWFGISYLLIAFFVLLYVHRVWKVNETAIAQLLDETYPQLEESSSLLLQQSSSLSLLESLQYNKTQEALSYISSPLKIFRRLIMAVVIFIVALLIAFAVYKVPYQYKQNIIKINGVAFVQTIKTEAVLPQIDGTNIDITPPAYTKKNKRSQQSFNLLAEEGALIDWKLKTTIAAVQVKFIFNDTLNISLVALDAKHMQWHLSKKMDSTGFYQVNIDGKISELYKIETIRDQPPVIIVQSPKQYTTIDYGEPQVIKLNTSVSDDYGIDTAHIIATIASGSGEAVKFKEQKIDLLNFAAGKTQFHSEQALSLAKLGMQPGDELYFYVQATDNHRQQTRSDVYIVRLPDTAQLMSLEGMANSLTLKPEYFRSERQIIIETEQLLKDKDTISEESFKNKSNNLGIDQKLLRLRYGKFLGDESESGAADTHELEDPTNFSDAEKLKDAYTDKHDNAEDATFFEPAIKMQLKATLTEMWSAEMRLRTFTPQTALPFEYKALRLLKDLQQQSRAYVAKTNYKTTPLDLKKRLTGDLSKIDPATIQKNIKQQPDLQLPVRNALAVLEEIKTGNKKNISAEILQQANLRLHEKAIHQPSLYLGAVEALKKIMTDMNTPAIISTQNILAAEQGLQRLLETPNRLPSAENANAKKELSGQYFDNLQKKQP
jgi:hypothetical protein